MGYRVINLYVDDENNSGMEKSWVQYIFKYIMGLFDRLGLQAKFSKTKVMVYNIG